MAIGSGGFVCSLTTNSWGLISPKPSLHCNVRSDTYPAAPAWTRSALFLSRLLIVPFSSSFRRPVLARWRCQPSGATKMVLGTSLLAGRAMHTVLLSFYRCRCLLAEPAFSASMDRVAVSFSLCRLAFLGFIFFFFPFWHTASWLEALAALFLISVLSFLARSLFFTFHERPRVQAQSV